MPAYKWDSGAQAYRNLTTGELVSGEGGPSLAYDWSDDNVPWAYTSVNDWEQDIPSGATVVNLSGTGTLYSRLNTTLNAVGGGGRVIVRLPEGVFNLNEFRVYSGSGNVLYAFGFYFARLQGLIGAGPDKTVVQMDANSLTQAQLDAMATLDPTDFSPLQLGVCRIDGNEASPFVLGGLTFRSADQQNLTAKHPNLPSYIPQPAPHQGVFLYSHDVPLAGKVSHVRFQGVARALNSQPPFECANAQTGRGYVTWRRCEFDGRRAPELDPARPRRCGVVMINSEYNSTFEECWFHHSNLSRYAANDQNHNFGGAYNVTRCKLEQITTNQNSDPAINGGNSLGGWTNATPFGWESCNGTITVTDSIVCQDNPNPVSGTGQIPMMFQLTSVGSRNPQGGRFYGHGNVYKWVHSHLDGYAGFRISQSTYWWSDGFNTTLDVRHTPGGPRLQPYVVTGTWPPSASALASAGVSPSTHYLVRST